MQRFPLPLRIATLAVLAVGCNSSEPGDTKNAATRPASGTVRVEILIDAEEPFAALGRKAWIFKHSGGPLTADFTVYHRRAGKDMPRTPIWRATGDDAVSMQLDLRDANGRDADMESMGGLWIAAMPGGDPMENQPSELMFISKLHSSVGGVTTRRVASWDKVMPAGFSLGLMGSGGGWEKGPFELKPGETRRLASSALRSRVRRLPPTPTRPVGRLLFEEAEWLLFEIRVTALKDGRLPFSSDEERKDIGPGEWWVATWRVWR